MRAKYVLSDVASGLLRNITMTIAMVITMCLSMALLGCIFLANEEVDSIEQLYHSEVEVTIFLKKDISQEQQASLESMLRSDPLVRQATFQSKEDAYANFRKMFRNAPSLVEATQSDTLPASFGVKPKDSGRFKELSDKYKAVPGVDEVVDQEQTLSKLFRMLNGIQTMSAIVAIIGGAASLLLVANMIQIAAYSKRREVSVMKLVGASNWFIQMPFVLEAVFAAIVGAILAFLLLVVGKLFLIDGPLKPLMDIFPPITWKMVLLQLPKLAGIGALISAIAGWGTLRFYVRV